MNRSSDSYRWPSRTLCSCLESMRDAVKTMNFSYMAGLIEEAQWAANRMESALSDRRDVMELKELRSKLRKECAHLEKEVAALKKKAGKKEKPE